MHHFPILKLRHPKIPPWCKHQHHLADSPSLPLPIVLSLPPVMLLMMLYCLLCTWTHLCCFLTLPRIPPRKSIHHLGLWRVFHLHQNSVEAWDCIIRVLWIASLPLLRNRVIHPTDYWLVLLEFHNASCVSWTSIKTHCHHHGYQRQASHSEDCWH